LSKDVSKFLTGLGFDASKNKKLHTNHDKKRNADKASPTKMKGKAVEKLKGGKKDEVAKPVRRDADKSDKAQRKGKATKSSPAQGSSSTTVLDAPIASSSVPVKSGKTLFSPTADWYNLIEPLPAASSPVPSSTTAQIASLASTASALHATEISQFSSSPNSALVSSASDQAFLRNILSSGTLSDRLSALTLMVQSSPLHNTRALEVLKGMVEKGRGGGGQKDGDKGKGKGGGGGRDERLKAARAIVDWWVGGGAPKRKLKCVRLNYSVCLC
jgi:ribosome biogenesis protein MAK21